MHVAIDARELCGRPTGVGRYLSGLLAAWAQDDAARRHDWTLIAPAAVTPPPGWKIAIEIVEGGGGTAWEQLALPRALRRQRPDVFFAPGYTAPLTVAAPIVLTIHDVSFFAHREWFAFREGLRRRLLTAWSARRARRVITDTEFSASEIRRFIGIKHARVIPLGISRPAVIETGSAGGVRRVERVPGTARAPMVLYVGSIFERRRVDRLIEAFDDVARRVPGVRLEVVGENRTRHPRLDLDAICRRSAHADRITIRSYVDDATLAQLYRDASVFAFLSEYEGFGLTPLEALVEGVPPVVLDTAVARETCGAAARYIGAGASNPEIADAIVAMLTDQRARGEVLGHAEAVLARYDWHRTAAETLAVLEEAAGAR